MDNLAHAVNAAMRGWHVFPVEPMGKLPHLVQPDRKYRIKWSEYATADVARVCAYWRYSPDANIGIACKPSGLLVVDCDVSKEDYALRDTPFAYLHDGYGPRVEGVELYQDLCESLGESWSECSDTYTVRTGSGGLHYYYRWPAGVHASQSPIAAGVVDVRGSGGQYGGYVLGAGSRTDKGAYLALDHGPSADHGPYGRVADAPAWLVAWCRDDAGSRVRPGQGPPRGAWATPRDTVPPLNADALAHITYLASRERKS